MSNAASHPAAPTLDSFEGRRAFVTGASAGIGRAIAQALHARGAQLVLHHYGDARGAAETARTVGNAAVLEADFTEDGAPERLAEAVLAQYGPIDILIASAAIERRVPWTALSSDRIAPHVLANFVSLLALCRAFVPPMQTRGWGRVVAIGSVLAARPRSETIAYAAMKSAQRTALQAIAWDVAADGVTLNVVSPGAIEVDANAARHADPDFRRAVLAKIPAARTGRADDVAGAVSFLCSDAAAYVTGIDLPVDGGWAIGDAPGALPGEAT